jgi:rubrerythrin
MAEGNTKGEQTMTRLIDADVVIKHIEEYWEMVKRGKPSRGMTAVMQSIKTIVNSLPTIDAEPVRHGKWVESDEYDEFSGRLYRCSNCNTFVIGDMDNYCPFCGARMDKE